VDTRIKSAARIFSGQGARAGYLAAIDQSALSLANFVATVVLARAVSPTELGIYGVGFTSLRLVRAVQEGLVIQPLNTFGAGMDAESFRSYASLTSLVQLFLAALSAGVAALAGWQLERLGNDTAGPALFGLWFAFLTWQLQEHLRRMLYTRGEVFNAVTNTLLANGVRLGVMFWWGQHGRLSGSAGLDAIAWGSLAALAPGLWQTRKFYTWHMPGFATRMKETLQRNLSFGVWVMGSAIANWLSVEFYPILTAGMISFAAAGAYRALQNLVAPIHLLLRAIDTFLAPHAARRYQTQGWSALVRNLRLTYLVSGIPIAGILLLAILFPVPLLRLVYGQTYLDYSAGMVLMATYYGLLFAYWPLQTIFKAAGLSRPIFASNLIAILTMATVGVWMIHQWGVYGTIGGQALNAIIITLSLGLAWHQVQPKA
jgi:O-antigen/teichoic acid export membrane protein